MATETSWPNVSIKKAWVGTALLVAGSTCFAIALAELAVRVLTPRSLATSSADRYGLALHYPGITQYLYQFGQEVTINDAGMRDREHALEKPDGTFRILVLGDSFMEAYQVSFEEAFSSLLERALGAEAEGEVEVINAGVSGWGTDDQLRYLTHYGIEYDPDLVLVVMTLHNDVSDNLRQYWHTLRDGDLVEQEREPIPLLEFASLRVKRYLAARLQLVQVWREVRHRQEAIEAGDQLVSHVEQLFQSPTPERIEYGFQLTEALLARIRNVAEENGARVALVLIPLEYQESERAYQEFVKTALLPDTAMDLGQPQRYVMASAERLGIPVIDLLPAFRRWTEEHDESLRVPNDGHWNQQGHHLAVDVVRGSLVEEGLVVR